LLFARLVGERGMVYAFEPDPANFELLRQNIEINGYKNVALIQRAVSDRPGVGRLYLSATNPGDHRFYNSGDGRAAVGVEAVTLDQVFERHEGLFNFIKFDIQGAEWAALQGMRRLLQRHNHLKIVTEFWPFGLSKFGADPAAYLSLLLDGGFELYEIDEAQNRIRPADPIRLLQTYLPRKENFTNLLCIKGATPRQVKGFELMDANRQTLHDKQRLAWVQAGDLRAFEKRLFSQNGEDGIIAEIMRRIGAPTRYFVEFGAEEGAEGNCVRLAREGGWQGLFLEADPAKFNSLAAGYRDLPGIRTVHSRVTAENIEDLLAANAVPAEFDVLSIDIDGNDYWVWSAIRRWHSRLVVIEYNAAYPPPRKWVMKPNPEHAWDGTTYYVASLASLAKLGREKGYVLVATNSTGVNAFFVRADLAADRFLDPAVHYHYSAPAYGPHGGGHPPGEGPFVEV
jgi:FkbM family methyltransferase